MREQNSMFSICGHTILGNKLSTEQSSLHTPPHLSKPWACDGSNTFTSVGSLLRPSVPPSPMLCQTNCVTTWAFWLPISRSPVESQRTVVYSRTEHVSEHWRIESSEIVSEHAEKVIVQRWMVVFVRVWDYITHWYSIKGIWMRLVQ